MGITMYKDGKTLGVKDQRGVDIWKAQGWSTTGPDAGTGTGTGTGTGGVTATTPANPTTTGTAGMGFGEYRGMYDALKDFQSKPLNYDPYTDPEYIAAQQMAREGAKSATKSTMETMNNRGLLKSSHTNSGLAQIEQKAELAPLQLVPGLIQNANMRHQQNFQNQLGLTAMAWDQAAYDDTNKRSDARYADTNSYAKAAITGSWMPPGAEALIDEMMKTKKSFSEGMDSKKKGNNIEQSYFDNLRDKGIDIRSQLDKLGIDSSKFGSDVGLEQGYKNASNAGIQTVESQKMMMDWLNNIQQTTGFTPEGAGDMVGGLSMFDKFKDIYGGMEGKPTLAREQYQTGVDQWEKSFGLETTKANHAMGYQNYLRNRGISEDKAQKATQDAITDLMGLTGNYQEVMKSVYSNSEGYKELGVDPRAVSDYLDKRFKAELEFGGIGAVDANGNPIAASGDPYKMTSDSELRVKAEAAVATMLKESGKERDTTAKDRFDMVETMFQYYKNGAEQPEPQSYKPFNLLEELNKYK